MIVRLGNLVVHETVDGLPVAEAFEPIGVALRRQIDIAGGVDGHQDAGDVIEVGGEIADDRAVRHGLAADRRRQIGGRDGIIGRRGRLRPVPVSDAAGLADAVIDIRRGRHLIGVGDRPVRVDRAGLGRVVGIDVILGKHADAQRAIGRGHRKGAGVPRRDRRREAAALVAVLRAGNRAVHVSGARRGGRKGHGGRIRLIAEEGGAALRAAGPAELRAARGAVRAADAQRRRIVGAEDPAAVGGIDVGHRPELIGLRRGLGHRQAQRAVDGAACVQAGDGVFARRQLQLIGAVRRRADRHRLIGAVLQRHGGGDSVHLDLNRDRLRAGQRDAAHHSQQHRARQNQRQYSLFHFATPHIVNFSARFRRRHLSDRPSALLGKRPDPAVSGRSGAADGSPVRPGPKCVFHRRARKKTPIPFSGIGGRNKKAPPETPSAVVSLKRQVSWLAQWEERLFRVRFLPSRGVPAMADFRPGGFRRFGWTCAHSAGRVGLVTLSSASPPDPGGPLRTAITRFMSIFGCKSPSGIGAGFSL